MKRTALHHYQRHTMSDANIMRGLVEDKQWYEANGGFLPEERKQRQALLANIVDYDHIEKTEGE